MANRCVWCGVRRDDSVRPPSTPHTQECHDRQRDEREGAMVILRVEGIGIDDLLAAIGNSDGAFTRIARRRKLLTDLYGDAKPDEQRPASSEGERE